MNIRKKIGRVKQFSLFLCLMAMAALPCQAASVSFYLGKHGRLNIGGNLMKYIRQSFPPGALSATARGCLILVSAWSFSAPSQAITVTQNDNALSLASAVTAGTSGLTVTSVSLSGQTDGFSALSSGTYSNPSYTYGIGPGLG
jgi:hypothetical protein